MEQHLEQLLAALQQTMEGVMPQDYTGKWAFIDMLKSVDCNEDHTVAWCKGDVNATLPAKQAFPAAGEHAITLTVLQADLRRPLVVGVLPQDADLEGCGIHRLGEAPFTGSVGLVFCKSQAQYMANGEFFGTPSATVHDGSVITLTVADGRLLATVDGQALPPVEGRLVPEGRYRFAVSLCGAGQRVAITQGGGGDGGPPPPTASVGDSTLPEGEALVGCRVTVKSKEEAAAAFAAHGCSDAGFKAKLWATAAGMQCEQYGGRIGEVVKFDASDDTHQVDFGDKKAWLPAYCLSLAANKVLGKGCPQGHLLVPLDVPIN
eukprot:EG_transcript_20312